MRPELDERTGELRLAGPTFAALYAHATSTPGPDGTAEQLAALRDVEALDGHGAPHRAIQPSLEAMADAESALLELSYAGKTMRGWAHGGGAALLLPANGDGRHLLTHIPLSLVPGAVAKLVELGPRAKSAEVPVRYAQGALGEVWRHWLLTARWTAPHNRRLDTGESSVEVIDANSGLWLLRAGADLSNTVEGGDPMVESTAEAGPSAVGDPVAWPATSTGVWRQIVRLVNHGPH